MSCEGVAVPSGHGPVCFINDPFASYGPHPGEDIGQCTWYAAGVRSDLDGITTGNASEWLKEAENHHVLTGKTPVVGAVAVNETADGGVGHVAYVAGLADNGTELVLDEANLHNHGEVFLGITTPAAEFQGYIYGGPAGSGPGSSSGDSTGGGSSGDGAGESPSGNPAAIVNSPENMNVFYQSTGNNLVNEYWTPTMGWVGQALAGGMAGDPAAIVNSATNMNVFYRSTSEDLVNEYWNPTPGWQNQNLP